MLVLDKLHYDKITKNSRDKKGEQESADRKSFENV